MASKSNIKIYVGNGIERDFDVDGLKSITVNGKVVTIN